jgi:hypothetical protein
MAGALGLVALLVSSSVIAAPTRSVLLVVEGARRGDHARDSLLGALGGRYAVLGGGDALLHTSIGKSLGKTSLSAALAAPGSESLAARVSASAREHGADAVVIVRLPSPQSPRLARLIVLDARSGAPPLNVDVALAGRPNKTNDMARIRGAMEGPLAGLENGEATATLELSSAETERALETDRAPEPAEPPAAALTTEASGVRDTTPTPPPSTLIGRDITRATVIIEPHVGIANRHFDYRDRISSELRPYALPAAPRAGIAAEVYPLVPFTGGALRGIGVSGEYAAALGARSTRSDGGRADTSWTSFDVALRYRVPIGDRSTIAGHAGYGGVDFAFSRDPNALADAPDASLPAVSYRFVRTGVDGRVSFWKLATLASIDYLFVSSNGPLDARFPQEKIGGVEARLSMAFPFTPHAEVRTGIAYQRFFYTFRPQEGDAYVAGGALDQMARWDSGVAFSY